MSRRRSVSRVLAGVLPGTLALLLLAMPGRAQVNNPFAPASATEPLTSASPSGGLNAGTYLDRARSAAGAQPNPFVVPPAGGAFQPAGPGGMQPYAPQYGAAAYGGQPAYGQPMLPTPTQGPPPVKVVTGERVYSKLLFGAYPAELLQDAEVIQVPGVITELKKRYFDDATHGDLKAGDNVWSNITERSDVMSPEEFRILNRILAALQSSEETIPREFFRLPVSTSDPLSKLPQEMQLEDERDGKISEWNSRVLAEFRKTKEDTSSEFWPVFIPPPPSAPRIEIPPGFNPAAEPGESAGPGGGRNFGGYPGAPGMQPGLEGVPPGTSSSYGFK